MIYRNKFKQLPLICLISVPITMPQDGNACVRRTGCCFDTQSGQTVSRRRYCIVHHLNACISRLILEFEMSAVARSGAVAKSVTERAAPEIFWCRHQGKSRYNP
jgi:hypothetical protein